MDDPTAAQDKSSEDPQRVAERAAQAMYANDHAARELGITLDAIGPGTATLSMEVQPSMVNGHAIGHGGYTFTLADTAFAYACNSYGDSAVAQRADISFIAPTYQGDRLSAEAVEQMKRGRNGIYDIRVTNQKGELVALFRGQSRLIGGRVEDAAKA